MEALRVLELYSGIGGMHFALKDSGISAQVVAAVDINTTANQIYQHNFPSTPLWSKSIEGIPIEDFNKLSFDMILMSPPCQPFTRLGLKRDVVDQRTKSFLYVLDLLPRLSRPPRYILLENVKGFEESCARDQLVKTLTDCKYTYQEIMVSPTSVGIPNSRLRYFLIAKISDESFSVEINSKILEAFPVQSEMDLPEQSTILSPHPAPQSAKGQKTCPQTGGHETGDVLYKLETSTEVQRKDLQNRNTSIRLIQDYLEPELNIEDYLLPPKTLLRYANILDIVRPTCRRSICFTKGYGRYVEGTGSVLQCSTHTQMQSVYRGLDELSEEDRLRKLKILQLRYFTPKEVANLMGFPQDFAFPDHIPVKQRYKVMGNSLNVEVVSRLLHILLS